MKYNLDPFGEHDDAALRNALGRVQLGGDEGDRAEPAQPTGRDGGDDSSTSADGALGGDEKAPAQAVLMLDEELAEFGATGRAATAGVPGARCCATLRCC